MPGPDETIYTELATTRTLDQWTPDLLRVARATANTGNLELAADFFESALGDDRVAAAISTRCKGLIALPVSFEASVRSSSRVIKALEAQEDFWQSFAVTDLAQLLAWGIGLGIGVAQLMWTERPDVGRLLPVLKVWHPRHLRYDWQRRTWTVRTLDSGTIDVSPGNGKWILYTPYGEARPWAFGVWRAIALWHLLKQAAIADWGLYGDKAAVGKLVATTPEQYSKERRREMANELFAMSSAGAVALPAGVQLELLESDANTYATFEAQKNAADVGIAVAIVGQNLSTEVSGPASTGATLHGRVLQVFIDADAETLATCLHDQALVWWAEYNFGSRALAPWPKWKTAPPADEKAKAEMLNVVAQAVNTLSNAGAPIDLRALLEEYGVPLRAPNEIEQSGQVYKYHLDYGALTLNEIRARLGLPPVTNGNEPPKPMALEANAAPADGARGLTRLRSGRLVRAQSGFVQGQLYADAVADSARDRAAEVLDPDVVAVLAAIADGESYEDIRTRLVLAYRAMNPQKLSELVEAAFTMAELGGRHAVNEDT